jgi:hypothetical protein
MRLRPAYRAPHAEEALRVVVGRRAWVRESSDDALQNKDFVRGVNERGLNCGFRARFHPFQHA